MFVWNLKSNNPDTQASLHTRLSCSPLPPPSSHLLLLLSSISFVLSSFSSLSTISPRSFQTLSLSRFFFRFLLGRLSFSIPFFSLSLSWSERVIYCQQQRPQNLKPVRACTLSTYGFYTVHYNACACTHYTVPVIHYRPILRLLKKIRKL